jgi:hypothetical protein
VLLGHLPQRDAQLRHVLAAEPVDHALAVAPALHQARFLQRLQVGAGQLDVDPDLLGQRSTDFSPCASISSISSRFGLASALPTRATCSYRRSLSVGCP